MPRKSDTDVVLQPRLPIFSENLVPADPKLYREQQRKKMEEIEAELTGMKLELADKPDSENLVKLHESQKKGRGYYERSLEIYRQYLKYHSQVGLLKSRATSNFEKEMVKATAYLRQVSGEELRSCRSVAEKQALAKSVMPETLINEMEQWEILEVESETNFKIVKTFVDEFKSIRDELLIQLSIVKNLIALGGLKINPETIRAMNTIEQAYKPSSTDINVREEQARIENELVGVTEGIVKL